MVGVLGCRSKENAGVSGNPSDAVLPHARCHVVLEAVEIRWLFGFEVHQKAVVRPNVVLVLVMVAPRARFFSLEFLAS